MSTARAGELLIVGFEGTTLPDELRARIAAGRVGGAILFGRNLGAPGEVAELVNSIGGHAPTALPLIVAIDQEGGRVQRLKDPLTVWPPMARVGALNDLAASEAVGNALGAELRLFGFNVDFAPVLDVNNNPENPVIGDRSFGANPEIVANHGVAFLRGLEAAGVRGCGKHFPGHGDTRVDSHLALPSIDEPMERLRAIELPPFSAAIHAGLSMLMTAHIVYPRVDEKPATLSKKWIEEMLRGELRFKGVVVSDDLDMKAIADNYSAEYVVREALAAGVDAFLACRDPQRQQLIEEALEKAALEPEWSARIERARRRLRAFRATLRPAEAVDPESLALALPNELHRALARRF